MFTYAGHWFSPPWVQPRVVSMSLLLSRASQAMQFLLQARPRISLQSHPKGPSPGLGKHGEAAQPVAGDRTHDIVGKFGPLATGGGWGDAGDGAVLEGPDSGRIWGHQPLLDIFLEWWRQKYPQKIVKACDKVGRVSVGNWMP